MLDELNLNEDSQIELRECKLYLKKKKLNNKYEKIYFIN
jgi:hypothetical protein